MPSNSLPVRLRLWFARVAGFGRSAIHHAGSLSIRGHSLLIYFLDPVAVALFRGLCLQLLFSVLNERATLRAGHFLSYLCFALPRTVCISQLSALSDRKWQRIRLGSTRAACRGRSHDDDGRGPAGPTRQPPMVCVFGGARRGGDAATTIVWALSRR